VKTINKPIKPLAFLAASLLAFAGFATHAAEAPPPPGVLATFACNFHDGKDMDDLMSARDYYVSESKKAGISTPTAYVWNRFRGGVPFDHIWFDLHPDLAAFAAGTEEYRSVDMSKVDARFEAIETCEANVAMVRPIFQGSEAAPPSGSTFISSNACTFRGGAGPDDLADLEGHIGAVLGGLDAWKSASIFAATPFTQGQNSADIFIFSINASPSAWAAGVGAIGAAAGGAALGRHFEGMLDCNTSLWFSEQVVGGED
jgi:hypothetical protein